MASFKYDRRSNYTTCWGSSTGHLVPVSEMRHLGTAMECRELSKLNDVSIYSPNHRFFMLKVARAFCP